MDRQEKIERLKKEIEELKTKISLLQIEFDWSTDHNDDFGAARTSRELRIEIEKLVKLKLELISLGGQP